MIFTAYFDESGTHGPEPNMVMACFIGHAYQWKIFERDLARLQAKYGFKVFHATDFRSKSKEFAGWSDEKCAALLGELTELVTRALTEGIMIRLEHDRFMYEYRAQPIPRKMSLDSQYGVCFRACLGRIFQLLKHCGKSPRLDVVIEGGHKNVGDLERIFNDLKRHPETWAPVTLGTISIATKTQAPPLMVADMLAASYSMVMSDPLAKASLSDFVLSGPPLRGEGFCALELTPDALTGLKQAFDDLRRHRAKHWRARKAQH